MLNCQHTVNMSIPYEMIDGRYIIQRQRRRIIDNKYWIYREYKYIDARANIYKQDIMRINTIGSWTGTAIEHSWHSSTEFLKWHTTIAMHYYARNNFMSNCDILYPSRQFVNEPSDHRLGTRLPFNIHHILGMTRYHHHQQQQQQRRGTDNVTSSGLPRLVTDESANWSHRVPSGIPLSQRIPKFPSRTRLRRETNTKSSRCDDADGTLATTYSSEEHDNEDVGEYIDCGCVHP